MDHMFGTTPETQEVYNRYENLRRKLNVRKDSQIKSSFTRYYYLQIFLAIANGTFLIKNLASESPNYFAIVSGIALLIAVLSIAYNKPRSKLYQLHKQCDKLRESGELVEITEESLSLWQELCKEVADLGYARSKFLLRGLVREQPFLRETIVEAQRDITRVNETSKPSKDKDEIIDKIKEHLKSEMQTVLVGYLKTQADLEALNNIPKEVEEEELMNELRLRYDI